MTSFPIKELDMSPEEPKLFITKGMHLDVSSFSISIDENGQITSEGPTIHSGLDMCPYWLEIAYVHLLKSEIIHNKLQSALNDNNASLMGELLQEEFVSGMQVIMASCIAIDSYYASIKDFANIPAELACKWRTKRTARHKQIAETLKRVFVMPQNMFMQIRELLKQSFNLRDKAVHPEYGTDLPVLYPEINKITDWRYSAFRYSNAKAVAGNSLSLIFQTAKQKIGSEKQPLKTYCGNLVIKLEPTYIKWVASYGELF